MDQPAYEASQIDWRRLRAFANRVAKSTTVEPQPSLMVSLKETFPLQRTVRSGGIFGFGAKDHTESYSEERDVQREVLGPHWILDQRRYHRDEWLSKDILETDDQITHLVLESDGSLTTVYHKDEGRSAPLWSDKIDQCVDVRRFNDDDVTSFDFEKVSSHWEIRGRGLAPTRAMNEQVGRKLLRHAKGAGLSMRLKELQAGPLGLRPTRSQYR